MSRATRALIIALAALPVLLAVGVVVGGRISDRGSGSLQPTAGVASPLVTVWSSPAWPIVTVTPRAPRPVVTVKAPAPSPLVTVKAPAPSPLVTVKAPAPSP